MISDDPVDSPVSHHESDCIIPPLRTPYTGGYAPDVHHIEIENAHRLILYCDGPLASTADTIVSWMITIVLPRLIDGGLCPRARLLLPTSGNASGTFLLQTAVPIVVLLVVI